MSKFFDIISVERAIEHLSEGGKLAAVGMLIGEYIQKDSEGNLILFNNEGTKTEQLMSIHPHEMLFPRWYIFE
jgi:hypothetical protein